MELAAAGAPRTAGHHGCRPVTRRGHDMCSEKAAGWQQAGEGLKGCCGAAAGWRQAAGLLGSRCRLRGAAGLLRGRCRPEMGCTATAGLWAHGRADCKPAGPETSCTADERSAGPRAALPGWLRGWLRGCWAAGGAAGLEEGCGGPRRAEKDDVWAQNVGLEGNHAAAGLRELEDCCAAAQLSGATGLWGLQWTARHC